MRKNEYLIYLRILRNVQNAVFSVGDNGNIKNYFDRVFNTLSPYAGGQQIKRCVTDTILEELGVERAAVNFQCTIVNGKVEHKQPISAADPTNYDQLINGYMALKKANLVGEESDDSTKRRSPISYSAMRAIHPFLVKLFDEEITFDRSDKPENNPVTVTRDKKVLTPDELDKFLEENNTTIERRLWFPKQKRTSGLYIVDFCIDLRTLFCVSINQESPEVSKKMIEKMKGEGWILGKNAFGACLILPEEQRKKVMKAIAYGLLNWSFNTNQSRTLNLMDIMAISITNNANKQQNTICSKLISKEEEKAELTINKINGSDLFVAPSCGSVIVIETDPDAIEKAEQKLFDMMNIFDFEHM